MVDDEALHSLIKMGEEILRDLDSAIFADITAELEYAGDQPGLVLPGEWTPEQVAEFRSLWIAAQAGTG